MFKFQELFHMAVRNWIVPQILLVVDIILNLAFVIIRTFKVCTYTSKHVTNHPF
jgi:hypothetical protein